MAEALPPETLEDIPLVLSPPVAEALHAAILFLRERPVAYQEVWLLFGKLQGRHDGGPLTDLLRAIVHSEP